MALIWHGPAVLEKMRQKTARGLDKAAVYLQRDIVQNFGSPEAYPEEGEYVGIDQHRQSQKNFRKAQHSAPGEPPFVQTGHLRRSITFDAPNETTRRVGSSMKPGDEGQSGEHSYGYYLEYGTSQMLARPWMHPALLRCKAMLKTLIAGG